MSRKVIITKTAKRKLEQIFDYLSENWNPKIKNDFVIKLDKSIHLIKTNPESFPESTKMKGLHKFILTKHNTLFYRFDDSKVVIITIFDTRQHPNKLKKDV